MHPSFQLHELSVINSLMCHFEGEYMKFCSKKLWLDMSTIGHTAHIPPKRLRDTGSLRARRIGGRPRATRTPEFEEEVLRRVDNDPATSTRRFEPGAVLAPTWRSSEVILLLRNCAQGVHVPIIAHSTSSYDVTILRIRDNVESVHMFLDSDFTSFVAEKAVSQIKDSSTCGCGEGTSDHARRHKQTAASTSIFIIRFEIYRFIHAVLPMRNEFTMH
ncbi:hypothetical protein C0J52_13707 [Blattella germanica]|nr:hypothetical protein C0J52_13707 [Blattella germanica]